MKHHPRMVSVSPVRVGVLQMLRLPVYMLAPCNWQTELGTGRIWLELVQL